MDKQLKPLQGLSAWLRNEAARHDASICRNDEHLQAHIATLQAWAREVDAALASDTAGGPTVPQAVLDALRFYAHGHHYNIDDDHQQFDTVSGEPQNWLFSERDDDCTMIEDGSIARAALCGGIQGFEEPLEPLKGEVLHAAPTPTVSADAAAPRHLSDGTVIDKSVVKRLAAQFGLSLADAAALEIVAHPGERVSMTYEQYVALRNGSAAQPDERAAKYDPCDPGNWRDGNDAMGDSKP
jgi:hypothetical protein